MKRESLVAGSGIMVYSGLYSKQFFTAVR